MLAVLLFDVQETGRDKSITPSKIKDNGRIFIKRLLKFYKIYIPIIKNTAVKTMKNTEIHRRVKKSFLRFFAKHSASLS